MGTHVFIWPRQAEEVFVTGTFDDWGKTIKLDKKGDSFEKEVQLLKVDEKIYYKFVVDGNWTTDHGQSQEADASGNVNNVLKPEDFATAGDVEKKTSPPGAFPETPANEVQEFFVKPIAATEGSANPVQLQPGESLPDQTGDVNSTVTTSKEDYEKAGSVPLPVAVGAVGTTGATAAAAAADNEVSIPEKSKNLIPESSLPVEQPNPNVQSAGANATTAELAGQVPLEPKREAKVLDDAVPEVVKESIAEAKEAPEATANPEAVEEKKEVEAELLKEVRTTDAAGEAAPTTTASAGAAGSVAADVPEPVKESIAESKQEPEAAASPEAVREKAEVESELLKSAKVADESGEPASTTAAAVSETAPAPTTSTDTPAGTTGVESAKTETTTTPETPSKSANADAPAASNEATPTNNTAEEKKKKRRSFFGKIKDKLKG